ERQRSMKDRSLAGGTGEEVGAQPRSAGGKKHLESLGTDTGHSHGPGALQEDRVGPWGSGSPVGGFVSGGARGSAPADHSRLGCDRRSALRETGRTFLSRLLRTLLLSATVHLLRRGLVVRAAAAVQHRWSGGQRGSVTADRAPKSSGSAAGRHRQPLGTGIPATGS